MAKRNTKQHIMDAATTLFSRVGYHSTTCEDIAGAVGIRPSALYKHFASKRCIYVAVVKALAERAEIAITNKSTGPIGEYFTVNPESLRIMLLAAIADGEDYDVVSMHFVDRLARYVTPEQLFAAASQLVWDEISHRRYAHHNNKAA